MLAEDPRSAVGERRDECQSILRFYKWYVRVDNREDSHIYILLLSLNVLQFFGIITNAFTYITLVAIYSSQGLQKKYF